MKKSLLVLLFNCLLMSQLTSQTIRDVDGNEYETIIIGNQTWMKSNLRVTHLNDGVAITKVTGNDAWSSTETAAYCSYMNNPAFVKTYGLLYNYAAVETGHLAPDGWHVATKEDWNELAESLGGVGTAGAKLKEAGLLHWKVKNAGATNASHFTALPAGYRDQMGSFSEMGSYGRWWMMVDEQEVSLWEVIISGQTTELTFLDQLSGNNGMSVRCVKNKE